MTPWKSEPQAHFGDCCMRVVEAQHFTVSMNDKVYCARYLRLEFLPGNANGNVTWALSKTANPAATRC